MIFVSHQSTHRRNPLLRRMYSQNGRSITVVSAIDAFQPEKSLPPPSILGVHAASMRMPSPPDRLGHHRPSVSEVPRLLPHPDGGSSGLGAGQSLLPILRFPSVVHCANGVPVLPAVGHQSGASFCWFVPFKMASNFFAVISSDLLAKTFFLLQGRHPQSVAGVALRARFAPPKILLHRQLNALLNLCCRCCRWINNNNCRPWRWPTTVTNPSQIVAAHPSPGAESACAFRNIHGLYGMAHPNCIQRGNVFP